MPPQDVGQGVQRQPGPVRCARVQGVLGKDLRVLLRDTDGKMGHTKHLSEDEIAALEAYLETL